MVAVLALLQQAQKNKNKQSLQVMLYRVDKLIS
jgi:hypothetical protein